MTLEVFSRRATLNDRSSVTSIIKAYGGRDYLSSYYNDMIDDPSFVGVVAEMGRPYGGVVAFTGAYIVDNGQTMSTKGSRVREDLQGKGVYKQLWKFLVDKVKERCPNLKYEEFTINTVNPLLNVPLSQRKYFELYRQPLALFNVPLSLLGETRSGNPLCGVVEVTPRMLRQTLTNEKLSKALFPIRLVIDWAVYRPIVENVDIIERHWKYVTGSVSSVCKDDLELILFGSWFQSFDHLAYQVDVYGKADDVTILVQHFLSHIKKGVKLFSGRITLLIYVSDEYLRIVKDACLSLTMEQIPFFSSHSVILSRDLKPDI